MNKQPYTTNKTKVVFLKQRPHARSHKGSRNLCITCDRNLQDPYIFCSLSCKVQILRYSMATFKFPFFFFLHILMLICGLDLDAIIVAGASTSTNYQKHNRERQLQQV